MITDMTQEDELVMLRQGGRELGRITARLYRTMRAAVIEMHLNGAHAGMQWVLGAVPPEVDEGDGLGWDGVESAQAWFDRVEAADRAASEAAA